MKFLIIGGSGFIGTNLIKYYERTYQDIDIFNIDIKKPRITSQEKYWIELDIMDSHNLEKFIKSRELDAVVHLAARVDLNGQNDSEYLVNTEGTLNLINAIKKSDTIKNVIFASSMLVCEVGYIPKDQNDYNPTTVYGQSKVDMENIIKNSDLDISWSIVRPTSIWGPWFEAPYKMFFDIVLKGLFFHPGDKACTKTYGYVGNSVYQIDKLINAPKEQINKLVFYLGDEPAINISQWADEIRQLSKGKNNIRLPYFMFIILAKIGDFLKFLNIDFPMTSFRLKNMTTNNIIDLKHLYEVVGNCPYKRDESNKLTLEWLKRE